ncbi:MAG: SDR family oxidoreductase [Actinomycetota bacterium]|nr:SDR family oxidoreductase [Actinomycetota bacterium]
MASTRYAVVTGAGSGIGRSVANILLRNGWGVALAGRTRDSLEQTAGLSDLAKVVPTDVSDPGSVQALFATVQAAFGRLDLLVNNAGTFGPSGTVDQISYDDWSQTIAVNLTGAFLCAHHAAKIMRAQRPRGGRIINNGSISAHSPRPGSAAYTASKHAITGLTKSIALDGRADDIACGQIDIGNAETELTRHFTDGVPQADGRVVPEPTFDAEHVAHAVLYMAQLPLDTNVGSLTITATKMPYVGRG